MDGNLLLISEKELEDLRYKAGIFDDLRDYCNINAADLLMCICQQDFSILRASNGESIKLDLRVHQNPDRSIFHPN